MINALDRILNRLHVPPAHDDVGNAKRLIALLADAGYVIVPISPATEPAGKVVWRCEDYRQFYPVYFPHKPVSGWTTIKRGRWIPDTEPTDVLPCDQRRKEQNHE